MSDDYNPYQAPESDLTKTETTAITEKKYTPVMVENLRKTRPWVLFMAIVGIVASAFMVLAGLGVLCSGAFLGANFGTYSEMGGSMNAVMVITGLLYLIFAGVYIPPIVFMFRYSISIKRLLDTGKTESLENALAHQKSFWKYVGIMTIIILSFIILAIIIMTILTVAAMGRFY